LIKHNILKMRKILLIAPLLPSEKKHREDPPLGLAYLASSLKKEGHQVKIFDMGVENEDLFGVIRNFSPEIIGIQMMTHHRFFVFKLAKEIKKQFPFMKIAVGGPHSTFTGKEILEKILYIDFIVKGEGEKSFIQLVNEVNPKDISGIVYRESNGTILETQIKEFCDLDELPYPAYPLLNLSKYKLKVGGKRTMAIFTSRGCPNKCIFCVASAMWPWARFRNPSNVLGEIKLLKEKFGYKAIVIEDDTFGLNKEFAIEIVKGIKSLDMPFAVKTRINVLDERFLEILKNSGCREISFGVESGDGRILKMIKKNLTLSQIEEITNQCVKFNFNTNAYFMLGNLGENEESASNTLQLAGKLSKKGIHPIYSFGVCIFPGTELEKIARERGYLPNNFSWTEDYYNPKNELLDYSPFIPILETPEFKIEDIVKFQNKWLSFRRKAGSYFASFIPKKFRKFGAPKRLYRRIFY